MVKCKAITNKGIQCKHDAQFGDWCIWHYWKSKEKGEKDGEYNK